ncbi:MAG TPA: hypothetical protein VHB53_10525 [Solirubrobacterales bacterium]|nr:hypothetical protein [Solirubrobacterales bacterium]
MRKTDWLVAATLALCAIGLVACGGGSGSSGGGSGGGEEARLEFAECMRAHGVEMEDPKPGKSIDVGGDDDPTTRKALAACNGKLGDGGQELSAEEDEELKEGALAFAQCMREEGIDMGDPKFLGRGKFHLDIAGIDTSSPAFEAAREACQGKMPELDLSGVGG